MNEETLRDAARTILSSVHGFSDDLPSDKDRLFIGDTEHWQFNACLSEYNSESAYKAGFEKAAKILARVVLFSRQGMDTLVYPIVYNYRQHLELQLKYLVRLGAKITDSNLSERAKKELVDHDLVRLWRRFEPFFEEVSGGQDDFESVRRAVEEYITQIHEIDPKSMAFRYDRERDQATPSIQGLRHINLLTFCSNIEKLCSLLGGVEAQFEHAWEHVCDMRSEFFEQ